MKNAWHTKTLFIQWWKYKWSYKYDHCIECKTVKFKHKWRWLCTRCWDEERSIKPNRIESKQKASKKWHTINKPRKPREEYKKSLPKPTWFDRRSYQKEWYMKNREVILFLKKWVVRKRKWLPTIEILWKHIPYIDLEKPIAMSGYDEWKKNVELFDKIRNFLTK